MIYFNAFSDELQQINGLEKEAILAAAGRGIKRGITALKGAVKAKPTTLGPLKHNWANVGKQHPSLVASPVNKTMKIPPPPPRPTMMSGTLVGTGKR